MRYFLYCRKSTESEDRQILSLESQLSTLRRTFEGRADIEVVQVYEEAFSAAAPGRPLFNEMLARINRGDAEGIISWAPDRLARNSIDGGQIVYLLDQKIILDLKFATYTFENNPQGKFMLQIMFGQSKYYSDALSENVKRGYRTKLEKGWRPNQAPLGYLNDLEHKTIVKDEVHFPLIRQIFELMLTGVYSPKEVAIMARDQWGFCTPKKKRIGGRPLALSSIYQILSNPFYAGIIVWGGQTYPGKHEAVISLDEFAQVRRLLARSGPIRPQRHKFAFTGMIRCGSCARRVTAEHKINRFGSRYTYYHCSKSHLGPRCTEPSIEVRALEQQIEEFLRSLAIEPRIETWILEQIALDEEKLKDDQKAQQKSRETALQGVEQQLNELTGLRVRNLLSDAEFVARRSEMQKELIRLRQHSEVHDEPAHPIEPVADVISFNNRAAEWFATGDDHIKRTILEIVGSNPILRGKILSIEAKKPFLLAAKMRDFSNMLGVGDDVRTNHTKYDLLRQVAHEVAKSLLDEDGKKMLLSIRKLREQFEPAVLAKQVFEQACRARAAARAGRARGADDSSHSPPLL